MASIMHGPHPVRRVGVLDERDGPEDARRVDQDGRVPEALPDLGRQALHGMEVRDITRDAGDRAPRAPLASCSVARQLLHGAGDRDDRGARCREGEAPPPGPGRGHPR